MTKFISSKKYGYGVQHYVKDNNDIVYYICYPDSSDLTTTNKPKMKPIKMALMVKIRESYVKKLRDELMVSIRLGNSHPLLEKKKQPTEFTFSQLAKMYFDYRSTKNNTEHNDLNTKKDQSRYNMHLTELANLDPNTITLQIIESLKLKKLKTKSQKTVNNILALLSAILNFDKDRELISHVPKIMKIRGIDNTRERYFNSEEIKQILDRLLSDNLILTIFVKLSLCTGGRLETIRSIRVKDINFN